MARPAKTVVVQDVIDPSVDQEKIEGAMVAMREQAQEEKLELLDLAGDVRAYQAFSLVGKFAAASQVATFKKIRDSKRIKDLPIRMPNGDVASCDSMREACPLLFGCSYDTMLREEESYDLLGEQVYEIANRLGLNRNALRVARALPPEKLEVVRLAIGNGSTKAEVLSVIEDLAEKAEEAAKACEDAKAEIEAKEQLLADKNKSIDKLKAAQRRIQAATPDELMAGLKKEATSIAADAEGAVAGLRMALVEISKHGDDDGSQNVFLAGLVGQVQAKLNALRQEFDLPDVSNAADQQLATEHAAWSQE